MCALCLFQEYIILDHQRLQVPGCGTYWNFNFATKTPVFRIPIILEAGSWSGSASVKVGSGSESNWKGGILRGSFWSIRGYKSKEKWVVGSRSGSNWKVGSGSGSASKWKVGSGSASKWKTRHVSASKVMRIRNTAKKLAGSPDIGVYLLLIAGAAWVGGCVWRTCACWGRTFRSRTKCTSTVARSCPTSLLAHPSPSPKSLCRIVILFLFKHFQKDQRNWEKKKSIPVLPGTDFKLCT